MGTFNREKIFYSISEVAKMLDVNESLLRYWEKEFDTIRPKKTEKGTRQYRKEDIDEVRRVYFLVKQKGMTLSGAKQKLKDNKDSVIKTEEIVSRLELVKTELLSLKKEFDSLDKDTI